MGETDKAKSFARKMPNKHWSKENLLIEILKGTEKYDLLRQQIPEDIFSVLNKIVALPGIILDDGTEPYNSDERLALYHKIIDIINIFVEKGSFGDYNFWLIDAHYELASLYAKKNDADAALNHLRLAAEHAVMYDSMPPVNDNAREEYTSLLFRGVKFPFNMVHNPDTMAAQLLERSCELGSFLPAAELDSIRNDLRKQTAIKQ